VANNNPNLWRKD